MPDSETVKVMFFGVGQKPVVREIAAHANRASVPIGGGLYMFYDSDARATRQPHNRWGIHGDFFIARMSESGVKPLLEEDVKQFSEDTEEETDEDGIPMLL